MLTDCRHFFGKSLCALTASFFLAAAASVPADEISEKNPAGSDGNAESRGNAAALSDAVKLEADSMRFSTDDGRQYLSGNVTVSAGALNVRTEELIYNTQTQSAELPAPAEVDFQTSRILIGSATYDGAEQQLEAAGVRAGREIIFLESAKVSASRTYVVFEDVSFYIGEPHWSSISFTTGSLAYDANEDYFHIGSSQLRVAGAPILPLPAISVMRFDRPPIRVWLDAGESSAPGVFYRSEVYLTLWDFEPGILLDFYERCGVLAGPAAAYDTRDSKSWLKMRGEFRSGYINDTSHRDEDIYGNNVTGRRGFIDWFHKQNLGSVEISASVHKWSDSEVERNFRPDIYDDNQNPDNYVEAVLPDKNYTISAFTRFQPNDYQNVQQRVPEVRFDLQPTQLGKTGIYQHLNASYAMLRERSSDQYDFGKNYVSANHDDYIESSRANVYVGWTAPVKFGDFASFTPVAGFMVTHYGETIENADESYTRVLGQLGFDLDFIFTRTWGYENKTWKIDGLRHVLRPVFQYRYIPDPNKGADYIPAIDREIYLSRPTILDLNDSRSIDQLYDEHVFRIGLENLFQTRAADYGSRDLVELNIYQDFRKSYRPDDSKTLSDNFIDFKLRPANWLSFEVAHRFDVYKCHTNSLSTSMTITDGDVWKIRFGTEHLYKNPYPSEYGTSHTRELDLDIEIRLNSFWSVFMEWEYNDRKNLMTDQIYGVRQRLGNTWLLEYSVRYRQDAGDDDDFSLNVGATILTF